MTPWITRTSKNGITARYLASVNTIKLQDLHIQYSNPQSITKKTIMVAYYLEFHTELIKKLPCVISAKRDLRQNIQPRLDFLKQISNTSNFIHWSYIMITFGVFTTRPLIHRAHQTRDNSKPCHKELLSEPLVGTKLITSCLQQLQIA